MEKQLFQELYENVWLTPLMNLKMNQNHCNAKFVRVMSGRVSLDLF